MPKGEAFTDPSGTDCINHEIADTLEHPTRQAADASVCRTRHLLAFGADVLPLALDVAESVKAKNSTEKMLSHQLAVLHSGIMQTMPRALEAGLNGVGLMNSAAKWMENFQKGLLTLQRLRTGGAQKVEVRHVTVQSGGQAVIGDVKTRGSRTRPLAVGVVAKNEINPMHKARAALALHPRCAAHCRTTASVPQSGDA